MLFDIIYNAVILSISLCFWFIEIGAWVKLMMDTKDVNDRKRLITIGTIGNLFIFYIFSYIININF